MDANSRTHVRQARDAQVRRLLGLPRSTHRTVHAGRIGRRWTDEEIRHAVLAATGGKRVRRPEYKAIRDRLNADEYPTIDTAVRRCPDLFL